MLDHVGGDGLMFRECPRHGLFGIMVGQVHFVENLQGEHPPLMAARRDIGRRFPAARPTTWGFRFESFFFCRHRGSSGSDICTRALNSQTRAQTSIMASPSPTLGLVTICCRATTRETNPVS